MQQALTYKLYMPLVVPQTHTLSIDQISYQNVVIMKIRGKVCW